MEYPHVKLALIQTKVSADIDRNLEKTSAFIRQAVKMDATIICLQELFATPYFAQKEDKSYFSLAETIPGKITNFLINEAKQYTITIVGGSIFEAVGDGSYYNTSLVINARGEIIGKYRKIHIPQDPKYFEKFYFKPGNLGYIQCKTQKIKIAPLICYDQWFPEPARINVLNGAQLLIYPTAIGWFDELRQYEPFSAKRWENAMCAHASMNGVYVAGINRVGVEDDLTFWGNSFIADPYGEVIARASEEEAVVVAELDFSKVESSQEGWRFLHNRRPDTYTMLTQKQEK